jgi:hypothetical protein
MLEVMLMGRCKRCSGRRSVGSRHAGARLIKTQPHSFESSSRSVGVGITGTAGICEQCGPEHGLLGRGALGTRCPLCTRSPRGLWFAIADGILKTSSPQPARAHRGARSNPTEMSSAHPADRPITRLDTGKVMGTPSTARHATPSFRWRIGCAES